MEKTTFCDQMDARLRDLESYLRAQSFAAPSTREKAMQQERARPAIEAMRGRLAEIKTRVERLRSSNDTSWDGTRDEIERDCETISRELDELKRIP